MPNLFRCLLLIQQGSDGELFQRANTEITVLIRVALPKISPLQSLQKQIEGQERFATI